MIGVLSNLIANSINTFSEARKQCTRPCFLCVQLLEPAWWLYKYYLSSKIVLYNKLVTSLAVKHYMIVDNYFTQGLFLAIPCGWNHTTPWPGKNPQQGCCCTSIAVNIHRCIYSPDVSQQLGVMECNNSGFIDKEDPGTGDWIILYKKRKLKVWVCIRITMMVCVEVVEARVSCGVCLRSLVFFTEHGGCQWAWTVVIRTLIIETANFWQL